MPGLDAALLPRLDGVTLRDAARLRTRLAAWGRASPATQATAFIELASAVAGAEQRIARREAARPPVTYPDLPVTARRADIQAALAAHQVVVVAGETGSGKTTQLPKMLLEQGRGIRGTIGHTQPRRIAARAVAERLAEELGVGLGEAVGYTVRFTDTASDRTLIRVMTDGVLLAEIHDDPLLLRYDALIIDEAHERSLTIDMLLGYLTRLLPQRPDLSVVITSATIDPQRFAAHFGDAPIIEVSGRTYPVEIRYRPWATGEDDPDDDESPAPPGRPTGPPPPPPADERDQPDAITDAVVELLAHSPGDVLVFCSGEREIRDAAEALTERSAAGERRLAGVEIVPLYARLSAAEQHRVFSPHDGLRVVIATNVAETSLTVPGIRYVVDTGTARISRFSRRTKVQRLPIEAISKASARQRSGRCGRVSDGICIRLYAESDFEARPEFTEPEILRTNLASVVLRMAALDVGAVEDFPFVDPPDRRAVRDAVLLLEELHAVVATTPERGAAPVAPVLTDVGRLLSRLPVDPRLGRMLVEASRLGCLDELTVLVAALSIVDPRERPRENPEPAETAHARFAQPDSDLLTLLALWRYLDERRRALSGSAFRRLCIAEYLNHRRVREWIDLVAQLRTSARDLGWHASSVGLADGEAGAGAQAAARAADLVHQAALAGLLSHVGVRLDTEGPTRGTPDYLGARGARFAVAPGSVLGRRRPRWVMAAELVETSRLYARMVTAVEPGWVEAAAGDLAVRSYSEPRWDRRRAQIVAVERVSLYGLPLVAGRSVGYGGIDAAAARELFIRHALVEDDWDSHQAFVAENRRRLTEAMDREERTRRREVVASEDERFAFFADRLPADIVSGAHFDRWWRTTRHEDPDLLTYDPAWLLRAAPSADDDDRAGFPDRWVDPETGVDLPVTYRFAPGADDDGVTIDIALSQLNRLRPAAVGWLVPGLRDELVTELIRSLPKALRRSFAPAPDHAGVALAALAAAGRVGRDEVAPAVADALTAMGGPVIRASDFDLSRLAAHLRLRIRVRDADGVELAVGRDVAALTDLLRGRQRDVLADLARGVERRGLLDWGADLTLPTSVSVAGADGDIVAYPALVDEGGSAGVRVFATADAAAAAMPAGVVRLLLLTIGSPIREVVSELPVSAKLALAAPPGQDTAALLGDCVAAAVRDLLDTWAAGRSMPRTADEFDAARTAVRAGLRAVTAEIVPVVARVLADAAEVTAAAAQLAEGRGADGRGADGRPGSVGGRGGGRRGGGVKDLASLRAALVAQTTTESRSVTPPAVLAGAEDVRRQLTDLVGPGFVSRTGRRRLPDLLRYVAAARRRVEVLARDPAKDAVASAQWQAAAQVYADALARLPNDQEVPPDLASVRWMLEEYRVSLFAQQIRTAHPVSEQRIRKAVAAAAV